MLLDFLMWIPLQYVNCMTRARVTELTVTKLTNRLIFSKNRHTRNKIISLMFATKTVLYHIHKGHITLKVLFIYLRNGVDLN